MECNLGSNELGPVGIYKLGEMIIESSPNRQTDYMIEANLE
jgi:hypothetical protein